MMDSNLEIAVPEAPRPALQIRNIAVRYPGQSHDQLAVRNVSFTLQTGQIACLLGASGCGKTSVLRAIAGFVQTHQGEVRIHGVLNAGPDRHLPPEARNIGVVFQDFALFPHLSVRDNVGFGLRRVGRDQKRATIDRWLELVGLSNLAHRFPHELSGGQQQRVALARALAPAPALLLMDEPFSALDVELRERLGRDVRQILKETQTTTVLVTHDQQEAFAMADEIGVMRQGEIAQWASAYNLYHTPISREIADFVGEGAFIVGERVDPTCQGAAVVRTALGEIPVRQPVQPLALAEPLCACESDQGDPVDVLLRPDDIVHDDASPLTAKVLHKAFRGAEFLYTLELGDGSQVLALVPSHHNHHIGEFIGIRVEADHVVMFPRNPLID